MKRKGISLVELLLAMALFGLLNLLMFVALQSGTRSYGIAMSRSSLQGDLNRSLARLQGEIRRSSASLVTVAADPTRLVQGQARHGLCLGSLQDWRANTSYTADGDPLWDEYIVYYATMEQPGRLVRQTHRPPGAPYLAPMVGFSASSHMTDTPATHGFGTLVLAQHLEEFRLRYDGGSSVLELQMCLRRRAGLSPQGNRVQEESVQANCQLRLSNP